MKALGNPYTSNGDTRSSKVRSLSSVPVAHRISLLTDAKQERKSWRLLSGHYAVSVTTTLYSHPDRCLSLAPSTLRRLPVMAFAKRRQTSFCAIRRAFPAQNSLEGRSGGFLSAAPAGFKSQAIRSTSGLPITLRIF